MWKSRAEELGIHLVFNFGPDLLREFGKADNRLFARQLATQLDRGISSARHAGIQVAGVQLDLDCPTRLLDKYADLVRLIRSDPALQRISFSATALPTWLNSGESFRVP